MTYYRERILNGGTYTTGAGLNWATQFETSSDYTSQVFTLAGELDVSGIAQNVCYDIGIRCENPTSLTLYVYHGSSGTLQIIVNGSPSEVSAAGSQTINLEAGPNLVQFVKVASTGGLVVRGLLFDPLTATSSWFYPGVSDPFSTSSSGRGLPFGMDGGLAP